MRLVMICNNGITMKSFCEALCQFSFVQEKITDLNSQLGKNNAGYFLYEKTEKIGTYSTSSLSFSEGSFFGPFFKKFHSNSSSNFEDEDAFFLFGLWMVQELGMEIQLADPIEVTKSMLLTPETSSLFKNIPWQLFKGELSEYHFSLQALQFIKKVGVHSASSLTFDCHSYGSFNTQKTALFLEKNSETYDHSVEHVDFEMLMIEVNLDDCTGETLGFTMEKLLKAGANDVFYTPIFMKKNRPAYKLSILTSKEIQEKIESIIFHETSSFGFRFYPIACHRMGRNFYNAKTEWGTVSVKIGIYKDEIVQISPEYEDCKQLADKHNIPLHKVYDQAKSIVLEKE
ncbi:nickel insertion protein [Metabacillus herbersteinensis]|uniref:Nickel insertion protein n=1 Tax=Metabacillus herbersteinensis TaxID=283816 RepID=A0ABV6GEG5_9BACI